MNSLLGLSELNHPESPLAPLVELSKSVDVLPERELNRSLDGIGSRSLENFQEGIIPNKEEGLRREAEVQEELYEMYPEEEGYEIVSEAYLRDADGNIVRDPETGEARRIDFVVVKDGSVVDSVEVTSETADKTWQTAKEERIREAGGNYVRTSDGTLAEFPDNVETRIERRK